MAAPSATLGLTLRSRSNATRKFRKASEGLEFLAKQLEVSIASIDPMVSRELRKALQSVSADMERRHSTPGSRSDRPGPTGQVRGRLYRRTGEMLSDIKSSVRVSGRGLRGIQGTIQGPGVHEFGAEIRATRSRYLTIPLDAVKDGRGVPSRIPARQYRNTFIRRSKRTGNLLIFQRRGKEIVPLFALKDRVKIPRRLGLQHSINQAFDVFIDTVVEKALVTLNGQVTK